MYTIHPLDAETSERIIARMMKENGFSHETASDIMQETLVYLHATQHTVLSLGPSALVDIGWHTFILYTREYAAYCVAAFGHFIHHCPTDQGEPGLPLSETIKFFEDNGITFDADLWGLNTQCVGQGGGGNCGTQVRELAMAQCNGGGSGGGNCTGCRSCGSQIEEASAATITGCTERCSTNCK